MKRDEIAHSPPILFCSSFVEAFNCCTCCGEFVYIKYDYFESAFYSLYLLLRPPWPGRQVGGIKQDLGGCLRTYSLTMREATTCTWGYCNKFPVLLGSAKVLPDEYVACENFQLPQLFIQLGVGYYSNAVVVARSFVCQFHTYSLYSTVYTRYMD